VRHWSVSLVRSSVLLPKIAAVLAALAIPVAAGAQEVVEYYGTDQLGSIRVVFDASGTVVSRADYLPYGEELAAAGTMPAEHFTGQARDGEAGMDYFHARQYQPRSGRFNAVDPVYAGLFDPQQWNRYAYARNTPLSLTDPTGMYNRPPPPAQAPDSNCRQSAGAYWCPSGALFIPTSNYVPSENPYDWGYHGGELAAGEAVYAAQIAPALWANSNYLREALGGGKVDNATGHTIFSKPENGSNVENVPNGSPARSSDGIVDPERPGMLVPISDGLQLTVYGNGFLLPVLTPRAQLLMTVPGLNLAVGAIVGYKALGKNQWIGIGAFASTLAPSDLSWDQLFQSTAWTPPVGLPR
jgi:RHS repeat-associated protein